MKRINLVVVYISILVTIASAQTPQSLNHLLGDGIFVQGGLGYLAVRDEYISKEKYSGSLPYFEGGWIKSHDSSAVRFGIEYRSSSDVRNNNVSAKVIQGGLNLDYIYPIGTFQIIKHDIFAFFGPSMEMYAYDRTENIAGGSGDFYHSYATLFFLCINSTLILPLGSDFSAEWSGMLNLIGWGNRSSVPQNKTKFISVISGISGYTNILLRYNITETFLLKVGYRFEISQSTSWDYLLSASDNVIVVLAYRI
ncbi:MAG: hypothetical protein ABSC53_14045 [Bacteroidota bacterium]